ncbi:MAG TPA: DUF3006 domain-containing protein [Bacillota bacterium]|jgi:hypothetical protein|nr:DUF3006 domain-containing protein [Bacillota bacterium]
MKTTLVIDRIEEGWAVLEYGEKGETFNIPAALLPEGAGEGDVIDLCISVKEDETLRRRIRLQRFLEDNMDD